MPKYISNKAIPASGRRQKGVAIITALLIVTLAATISISISTHLQLDVRRTSNMLALDQAHIYSLLTDKYFEIILQNPDAYNEFTDRLIRDGMAKETIPIDGGAIEAEATDLSACINVNSVVNASGNVNAVAEARLSALFNNKGINTNLTQAIIDWIDPDSNTTTPNGAEDGYYLNLEKPYRTANTRLQSISELRLIKGFEDNETYKYIKELERGSYDRKNDRFSAPALCAFIPSPEMPININTSSAEVLKSIQPDITETQIEDIIQQRTTEPLTSIPAVFTTPADLSTESRYYLLKTRTIIGNISKVMYSILYWDGTKTMLLSRTQQTL